MRDRRALLLHEPLQKNEQTHGQSPHIRSEKGKLCGRNGGVPRRTLDEHCEVVKRDEDGGERTYNSDSCGEIGIPNQ